MSWIDTEIDASIQREAQSILGTMADLSQKMRETMDQVTEINDQEGWLLYGPDQFEMRVAADMIKALVSETTHIITL